MEPTATTEAPTTTPLFHGKRLPSVIVAGGAAVAMVLAGLGIAAAQTDDAPTAPPSSTAPTEGRDEARPHRSGPVCTHRHPQARLSVAAEALDLTTAELKAELRAGRSIAQVAEAEGIAAEAVVDALVTDAEARFAQAVTDGKLTQAQADERRAGRNERITGLVNRTPPPEGDRRPGRKAHRGHDLQANFEVAAGILGMTPVELRVELRAGKSLATIAGERNVPVGQVVSALVADARARLAGAVSAGRLTQAEADERAADLEERVAELVDRTPRAGEGKRRGPGASTDAETEAAIHVA